MVAMIRSLSDFKMFSRKKVGTNNKNHIDHIGAASYPAKCIGESGFYDTLILSLFYPTMS